MAMSNGADGDDRELDQIVHYVHGESPTWQKLSCFFAQGASQVE
jgi:hypothetical protein